MPSSTSNALYLFCLARTGALSILDTAGLDNDHPLHLLSFQDVVAVVCTVSRDEFCGAAAEARMKDLAWLGPRVCHHEEVIELAMRSSPVVPARFATLFSSHDRLQAWLVTYHAVIAAALDRFTGHEEWAVKGTLNRGKAEALVVATALARQSGTLSAAPGVRYLEERRIRAGAGQELNRWLAAVCERIAADLRAFAVEFRERAPGPQVLDDEGAPICNWALLLPAHRVNAFRTALQQITAAHAEHGLAFALSGPWPPYSFCPSLEPGQCA